MTRLYDYALFEQEGLSDLNQALVYDENSTRPIGNPSVVDGDAEVVFRNVGTRLIQLINEADCVIGCVAWLTHPSILAALARKRSVLFVVQKEDFLRPDLDAGDRWRADLRRRYDSLHSFGSRYDVGGGVSSLSMCCDPDIEAVRCVGNHNADKNPAFPRAHHKFALFGRMVDNDREFAYRDEYVEYYAAWTGSFNFTKNACSSLENAVILRQPKIIRAFREEFDQVVALSEPLDWQHDWTAPQWRIGT